MKLFVFPLERVLQFRRREMEHAEERYRELALLSSRARQSAARSRTNALAARSSLSALPGFSGSELLVVDRWLSRLGSEATQSLHHAAGFEQQKQKILSEFLERRGRVKALEALRDRRRRSHDRAAEKLIDMEAAELHLARQSRQRKR